MSVQPERRQVEGGELLPRISQQMQLCWCGCISSNLKSGVRKVQEEQKEIWKCR